MDKDQTEWTNLKHQISTTIATVTNPTLLTIFQALSVCINKILFRFKTINIQQQTISINEPIRTHYIIYFAKYREFSFLKASPSKQIKSRQNGENIIHVLTVNEWDTLGRRKNPLHGLLLLLSIIETYQLTLSLKTLSIKETFKNVQWRYFYSLNPILTASIQCNYWLKSTINKGDLMSIRQTHIWLVKLTCIPSLSIKIPHLQSVGRLLPSLSAQPTSHINVHFSRKREIYTYLMIYLSISGIFNSKKEIWLHIFLIRISTSWIFDSLDLNHFFSLI